MPILDVEIALRPGETLRPGLAADIADRAAGGFRAEPGSVWVKLRPIPVGGYAENGGPADVYPVFVSVLKARLPSPADLQAEAARLAPIIAKICARPPENVHIVYLPEGVGRVAFGGKIVSD